MIRFVEHFLIFGAKLKCGRISYCLFDKWVEFCQKLLRVYFYGVWEVFIVLFLFVA